MTDSFRQSSRLDWVHQQSGPPSAEQIACGALQRIADATELMAKNYTQLQRERDNYERWYRAAKAEGERMGRSIAALRGYIKRLKSLQREGDGQP